jgi:hypothetical protein
MDMELKNVDHSAIRTSQVTMMALIILAFALHLAWLIAFLVVILVAGLIRRCPAFDLVYTAVLRPRGWVKPLVVEDHPEPHRFSQLLATLFLAGSSLALYLGAPLLGWALAWMVAGLAALNAFGGFCVGCAVYYWLNRLQVPGFTRSVPPGTFPGRRPAAPLSEESLNFPRQS